MNDTSLTILVIIVVFGAFVVIALLIFWIWKKLGDESSGKNLNFYTLLGLVLIGFLLLGFGAVSNSQTLTTLGLLAWISVWVFHRSRIHRLAGEKKPINYVEGGLYANPKKDLSGCSIIKILKIDEYGYHIRVYSNFFETIPDDLDENSLCISGVDEKDNVDGPSGAHTPIQKSNFEKWPITFIKQVEVKEEELEGYRLWEEGKGEHY